MLWGGVVRFEGYAVVESRRVRRRHIWVARERVREVVMLAGS